VCRDGTVILGFIKKQKEINKKTEEEKRRERERKKNV
jgi:hypothetical protein